MLSVIMLSVIMLSVVAAKFFFDTILKKYDRQRYKTLLIEHKKIKITTLVGVGLIS
jgi:hypothetical protein